MPLAKPDSALVIIGHGSTLNPDSSEPTHLHADEIRRRGIFREVVCAFWKEEPSMREVHHMLDSRDVYVVPNFISEGYFCQQVIPRELRLGGPVTEIDGRIVRYCDPVGIHPNMTRLLLQRADEVAPGIPRSETSLVIAGHGTSLNENSAKAIKAQVELIRGGGHGFAEVLDAYMEEAPFIADWLRNCTAANVVVVPFFIADGLHSYQDIPVLLGIEAEPGAAASEREVFRHNPHHLHGKRLYYSNAIGTEPLMADVILDQVADFDRKHGRVSASSRNEKQHSITISEWFAGKLASGQLAMGEIIITAIAGDHFQICHRDDLPLAADGGSLQTINSPLQAREIARLDSEGRFRPLKSAPNLKRGWLLKLRSIADLRLALDFLYPAAIGLLRAQEAGDLRPVPLRETLGRQTGMYRFCNTITDEQAREIVAKQCDPRTKCGRRILWEIVKGEPVRQGGEGFSQTGGSPSFPLLCTEACTHIVSAARGKAREAVNG